MSSVFWRILEETKSRLQNMAFSEQGTDMCGDINSNNIEIWKTGLGVKEGESKLPQVNTPALIITPGNIISRPAERGTNNRDDVIYTVAIQLIDSDGKERQQNLQSYLKWMEQIARAFHARSWPEIEIDRYGDVYASFAEQTKTMDVKAWNNHPHFVAAVVVMFFVREERGIQT